MRVGVVGAGAVGGFYAAALARAGHEVAVVARGAHLAAIRAHGLRVRSASAASAGAVDSAGERAVQVQADSDPAVIGACDLVLFSVKTYDNPSALPLLPALVGRDTIVLTLQNGVDSAAEVAAVVGEARVMGGAAYIATAIVAPGVIEQTGTHHRIVFGEVFGPRTSLTPRVVAVRDACAAAGIEVEAHGDGNVPLWEKFAYLAPFAGLTGAARLPIGPLRARPDALAVLERAVAEVEALARAEGVNVAIDLRERIRRYVAALPPTTRSSLLIDLASGKRIEVEALQGSVVRRAKARGLDVPVMATLYAALCAQGG